MARCITRPAHQIHTSTMRRVRLRANSATLLATAVADYGSAQKTNKLINSMVTWWDGSVLDANGLFLDRSPGIDTLHVLLTFQWSPVPLSFRVTARCITGPAHQVHTSTMTPVKFRAHSATL